MPLVKQRVPWRPEGPREGRWHGSRLLARPEAGALPGL